MAAPRGGTVLKFTVKNCPDLAEGWFYVSWLPDQPRGWDGRDWSRIEAVPGSNGEFTCAIPDTLGTFDWYGKTTRSKPHAPNRSAKEIPSQGRFRKLILLFDKMERI